jgi:uncharacterized protein (TIRG00374 family)
MSEREAGADAGKRRRRFRKRLTVGVILGVAVFVGLALYADFGDLASAFANVKWGYFPLIMFLALLNFFVRFVKWDFFLRSIGVRIPFRDSLAIFLSGLTMAFTPARLGEVFKSYLLKKANGTRISKSAPIVFAERVTDLLGMLMLAAISFSAVAYGREFLIGVLCFLILLIVVLKSRRVSRALLRFTGSVRFLSGLTTNLEVAFRSAHILMGMRNLVITTCISVVSAGVQCLAMYFTLEAFDADVSLMFSIFVYSFAMLAGSVSMIPGGLVAAEWSITGLLLLADVPRATAAGATMMVRLVTLWLGVVIGVAAIYLVRDRLLKKSIERALLDS